MNNLNVFIVEGNITEDVELKQSQAGKSFVMFSVVNNSFYMNKGTANFFNCVAFGKTAEIVNQYCKKGTHVVVHGQIQQSKKENKIYNNVIVNEIRFFNSESKKPQQDVVADEFPF